MSQSKLKLSFKQSLSNLSSLDAVCDLAHRVEQADGYPAKLYWHAMRERQYDNNALDYLCFSEGKFVGMLNVLFFAESVEITAIVDPYFRHQGIFKKLRAIAFNKLRQYIISDYIYIYNGQAKSLIEKCIAEGGQKDHFEVEMLAPENFDIPLKQTLTLQRAVAEDIPLLANIHEQCFKKPSAEAMERRFAVTMQETYRKAYLAKNTAGEVVGKLHVREDINRIYIHDVGVLPAYQRQGYAQTLMTFWLRQFAADYTKPIIVEVLGYNTGAIALYKTCGFRITNVYEFWKFPFR